MARRAALVCVLAARRVLPERAEPAAQVAAVRDLDDAVHRPAAHEAPQSAMAVYAAHAVVHQDVGRARGTRPAVGPNHAIGGECHLDLFAFEPLVEQVGGALREDFHQAHHVALREAAQLAQQL